MTTAGHVTLSELQGEGPASGIFYDKLVRFKKKQTGKYVQ